MSRCSRCIALTHHPAYHRAARLVICSVALCRCSCCAVRAYAGEIQHAALHMTHTAADRTAGKRQLAPRPTLSLHLWPDWQGVECVQGELQSDPFGAALEETKAQVEMLQVGGSMANIWLIIYLPEPRHTRRVSLVVHAEAGDARAVLLTQRFDTAIHSQHQSSLQLLPTHRVH